MTAKVHQENKRPELIETSIAMLALWGVLLNANSRRKATKPEVHELKQSKRFKGSGTRSYCKRQTSEKSKPDDIGVAENRLRKY